MKIAIIQDGPVYNQLDQSLAKAQDYISKAQSEGADLIVFGETWFCGYPIWLDVCKDVNLWDHEPVKKLWAETYHNAVDIQSDTLDGLKKQLKQSGLFAVLGMNEKVTVGKGNRSLYNTVLTIDNSGNIVNHHRKLMPTFTEKLVHHFGDGKGLNAVFTPFGRLGALICWEHWMPLTRQAMHDQAEDIHIALWPYVKETHQLASRHYAIEGRCHVVAVGQLMLKEDIPNQLSISESVTLDDSKYIMQGGSSIYAPNGDILLAPQYNEEKFIVCDLDISSHTMENMNLSVSGHYQRDDVFDFQVNKRRLTE